MAYNKTIPSISFHLSIAISCGWCAVSGSLQEKMENKVSNFVIDDIEGHKAFKVGNLLYIILQGERIFDDTDMFNEKYGEENVKIHDYGDSYILEVKI